MGLPGLVLIIILAIFAGYLFTGIAGLGMPLRLALSYPLGLSVITLQMFYFSLVGIPFSLITVAVPWLIALLLFVITGKRKPRNIFLERPRAEALSFFEIFLVLVLLFQSAFALLNSVLLPIEGFDTWVIWFIKGKAFYMDRAVTHGFFMNENYSNGNFSYKYPLSVPLAVTLGYLGLGYIDDRAVKIIFSLYFISLLGAFYYFLRPVTSRRTALLFTAMLSTVPRIMVLAGFRGVGYADLPLAVSFLAGAGLGARFIRERNPSDLVLAVLFFSTGAWIKNEGLTMLAMILIVLPLICFLRRDYVSSKGFSVTLGLVLASVIFVAMPWQAYKATLPALSSTMVSDFSPDTVLSGLMRLPFIFKKIAPKLFTANKYHISWAIYLIGTVLALIRIKHPGYLFLQAIIWFQFACYILVYVITPFDLGPHIDTSIDRLTVHLLPVALLSTGIWWSDFVEREQGV